MAKTDFQSLESENYYRLNDLGVSLAEFARKTNPFLYFYVEEIGIGSDYDGNIQIKYQVTDIEGSELTVTVTIDNGEVVCEPDRYFNFGKDAEGRACRGLIAGVDKSGKPISGRTLGIDATYKSSLILLLSDMERIGNKTGVEISRVIFPGNTRKMTMTNMKPERNAPGESIIFFEDESKNFSDLGAMVDEIAKERQGNEPEKVGAQLVPLNTSISSLDGDFKVADAKTGEVYGLDVVSVRNASFDDISNQVEMYELAEAEGLSLVVEGSSGNNIHKALDLVIEASTGKVLSNEVYLIHGLPEGVLPGSDVIGYINQQGVKLIAAR